MTTQSQKPPHHDAKLHPDDAKPHPAAEPPAPKPPSLFHDLDFWRFVLAALSLVWEVAKTWVR